MSSRINLILLLVLLIPLSSAASLSLPKEIPAHTNWSFSAALNPSDSFDATEIYFDGERVVSAYSNGRALIDAQNGGLVADAFILDSVPEDNSGLVLYVSYLGIASGEYEIRAEALSDGALIESVSGTIVVFDAAAKSYADELNGQIDALRKLSKEIEDNLNEIEKNIDENSTALEQKIAQSKEGISNLQALYSDFNSRANATEETLKENAGAYSKLNEEMQKLKKSLKEYQARLNSFEGSGAATGYATMGGLSIIAIVVAFALLFVVVWKERTKIAELLKKKKAF